MLGTSRSGIEATGRERGANLEASTVNDQALAGRIPMLNIPLTLKHLFSHVQLHVLSGEIGRVDGVFGRAEVEIDGDLEALLGNDFLKLIERSSACDPAFHGNHAIVIDIHDLLTDLGARVTDRV